MNEWDKALIDALKTYTDSVTEGVKKAVKEAADEALPEVKAASPVKAFGKNRGKYQKGWRVSERQGSTAVRALESVHNATDYQLTHLLEYGHKIIGRDGQQHGFVSARPHIAAVNEATQKRLQEKIESVIQKGG